ncbi:MAG: hypothetical protein IT308_00555 [Anaerolineaceae bacterium]|nr:hypothetical protein [Anaerolineaceae bacterium]
MTHQNDYNLSVEATEEAARSGLEAAPEMLRRVGIRQELITGLIIGGGSPGGFPGLTDRNRQG